MHDPGALVADIVTALLGNFDLVDLLSDDITGYVDGFPSAISLENAVLNMKPPAALVAWRGTRTDRRANADAIFHDYSVALRPVGPAAPVWRALREGVTSVSGQKFKLTQLNNLVYPAQNMGCSMRQLVFSESVVIEFFEVTFSLVERGFDI